MLELREVCAGWGPVDVLKGVSLRVTEGEMVALIGANGAGKSTMLMTICGILPIRRGQILFNGRPLGNTPPHEIVRLGIVQAPEGRQIFPRLTTLENLEMGAFSRSDPVEVQRDLDAVFEMFPILAARRRQPGGTLSGGEQQMLAIARAVMARPRLLLLDEPSLGLAPKIVQFIFEVIASLNRRGVTVFLVEQNANMALSAAGRAYVLETGSVVMSGDAKAILADPRIRTAYLGE
jgi:branched-chain amino acid transport system ATP-binding protein